MQVGLCYGRKMEVMVVVKSGRVADRLSVTSSLCAGSDGGAGTVPGAQRRPD